MRFRLLLLCFVWLLVGETAVSATNNATTIFLPIIQSGRAPRGYLTTPDELVAVKQKADLGIEPYQSAVSQVMDIANEPWTYNFRTVETCPDSDTPTWISAKEGIPILYSKGLAYHLSGNEGYASAAKTILERIMQEVSRIEVNDEKQCRLNFAWGVPELVATADLLEPYWHNLTCFGPSSTSYHDTTLGSGPCKKLFQNWLVKNAYYVISYSVGHSNSNWGAAATTATAYIADYLADRNDVVLVHRNPRQINDEQDFHFTPAEAYHYIAEQTLDRMNGYKIDYMGNLSCDLLSDAQQSPQWAPVKSQITENGIIPEDARREEFCNVPVYNGTYQIYPELHLSLNIQQCELMLRRGDQRCYDNVDNTDLPSFTYVDLKGNLRSTHLKPGRGSIERALKAIMIDANIPWLHESALYVAYRYYRDHHRLEGIEQWPSHFAEKVECNQDLCLTMVTHSLRADEPYTFPPTVPPPGG